MTDLSDLAAAERRDLADFVETLTASQWERASLCAGWSVRDVVAHVPSYDDLGWPALLVLFARSGFSIDRSNRHLVGEGRRLDAEELVARLRRHATPRGVTALFGCGIALTDGVIHHQDIRRALELPRVVPEERLVGALRFLPRARVLPAPANLRGLGFVASDVDWAYGDGPEVRGPGEALLLALAGRPEGLADLSGAGLPTLARRVEGTSGETSA